MKDGLFRMKPSVIRIRRAAAALLLLLAAGALAERPLTGKDGKIRVLGLKKVIAFTYLPANTIDARQLRSVTLIGPAGAGDWKYWQPRGVVAAVGHTWYDLLRSPVSKAVESLTGQDYGGNPRPVNMIDEFGFDYDGPLDQKAAQILRQSKLQKPGLGLAVWQMREPLPPGLAEAYRDAADLVMFESYVHSSQRYWWIATQAWSARKFGLLPKSIFVLGVGKGGNPGEDWAETKDELEEQIRFVRLIAPESPGVGFYSGTSELLTAADAFCTHFFKLPTNGSGLPADVRDLAAMFSHRHEKPTLIASPSMVGPAYTDDGSGSLVKPWTMRAYLINLGDADAHNVKLRLRNRPDLGGNVFAEGTAPLVPRRGEAIALLPVSDKWREWVGQWILEVDAPGCDVHIYKP